MTCLHDINCKYIRTLLSSSTIHLLLKRNKLQNQERENVESRLWARKVKMTKTFLRQRSHIYICDSDWYEATNFINKNTAMTSHDFFKEFHDLISLVWKCTWCERERRWESRSQFNKLCCNMRQHKCSTRILWA